MTYHGRFLKLMTDIGLREVAARPSLGERLVSWFVDTPIHAAEREYWLQHARRLKLKTDLQEERLQRRNQYRLVATYSIDCSNNSDGNMLMTVALEENRTKRAARFLTCIRTKDGRTVSKHENDDEFIRSRRIFREWVLPWVHHQITTEQLAKCEGDSTARKAIKVVGYTQDGKKLK